LFRQQFARFTERFVVERLCGNLRHELECNYAEVDSISFASKGVGKMSKSMTRPAKLRLPKPTKAQRAFVDMQRSDLNAAIGVGVAQADAGDFTKLTAPQIFEKARQRHKARKRLAAE
jgi:hypothetical protein